ncbi:mediator complex, subunit Med5 [Pseudoneurospora amorphoporcata]|uniref:Mediator of RNA polymerase II transcription subunit 5 n=1 Tax=Pseudoneurospora amorphoporcata TaxID=241081 RepID=A0AAN6SJW7_9PEZI|nr:mediator complex, subunit Med5 [Pseudoneurospora amorphoporcata]
MPGGPATAGLSAAVGQWTKFLGRAEAKRLDPSDFARFVPILKSDFYPLPPIVIANLLLKPTKQSSYSLDPRRLQYLTILLNQKLVNIQSVLKVLHQYSTSQAKIQSQHDADATHEAATANKGGQGQQGDKKPKRVFWQNSFNDEEVIFLRLSKVITHGQGIRHASDAYEMATNLSKWITLYIDVIAAFARDTFGTIQTMRTKQDMENSLQAFSLFLVHFLGNQRVVSAFSRPEAKGHRKRLASSIDQLMPYILQNPNTSGIAVKLEFSRGQALAGEEASDLKDAAVAEMHSYMDNMIGLDAWQIPEMPLVNSRAGLYIYINAALVGRPLIDDHSLYTYLHNRYQGDLQTTAIHLILASFDVLANAVFRYEGSKTGHLLKSFVVNKVPLILGNFAASSTHMYPFDAEFCISQALGQVDTSVFPTLSNMFDMSNTSSSFQDSVRQDFCFACQLHGLLSSSAIETLLGEITYQTLPDEGRYVKETLVQACLEDSQRSQRLIRELDNMNGNVGAAAQAIVEVIGTLCRNKETMTLKQLCSQLASKPSSLDILLLFDKPHKILHPLCELLDNWGGYDEDQGEYQPVYEEFGSILLLLLAFVHRYSLTPTDLAIRSPASFVGKLLGRGSLSRPLDELSDQEKSHLNGWVHGLFDSEAGGLGDDLMSSCPPQDFYLLMPTLFDQIVMALSTGCLNEYLLRSGLEYLLDTLLLPSLVPALLFLANNLRTDKQAGQGAVIKMLQLILRPNSISNEASTMLSSVLNIVAKPLELSLRSYQRQVPASQEVEPLLRALKENLAVSGRTGGADHSELENWTGTHHNGSGSVGGLYGAIRHTVQNLVQWAHHSPGNGVPTTYTHRQILVALQICGAKRLLSALLKELKAQTEAGNGPVAYDVVTAIICAPDVHNTPVMDDDPASTRGADANHNHTVHRTQRRITLRESLKFEAEEFKKIQKSDPLMAETVVRLHRRVEAQMALPPPPPPPAQHHHHHQQAMLQPELSALGVVAGDAMGESIMNAASVAVSSGDHHHSVDAMNLDAAGMGVGGLDVGGAVGMDLSGMGDMGMGGMGGLTVNTNTGGNVTGAQGSGGAGGAGAAGTGAGGAGGAAGGGGGAGGAGGDLSGDDIFSGLGTGDFTTDFGNWDTMDLG